MFPFCLVSDDDSTRYRKGVGKANDMRESGKTRDPNTQHHVQHNMHTVLHRMQNAIQSSQVIMHEVK